MDKILDSAVFEQFRFIQLYNLVTGAMEVRCDSLEDSQLECTTESEEVLDASGALVTVINKAKKAVFTANETFFNFALAAKQFGGEVVRSSATAKISTPVVDIKTSANGSIELTQTPNAPIKYIYKLEKNQVAETLEVADSGDTAPEAGKFALNGKTITLPADADGEYLVDYTYDADTALMVENQADQFPTAMLFKGQAYMRDKCTDERFLVWVIADKAKIDPAQLTLAFNSQGKHPITINFLKDYCSTNASLFRIIAVK